VLFLVFELARDRYVLDVSQIAEVLPLVAITQIPQAPPAVAGVLNYRGAPVPVIVRRRPTLRLAIIAACLMLGSAVAVALVAEPTPEEQPPPTTTPTTTAPAPPVSLMDPAVLLGAIEPVVVTTTMPTTTTEVKDTTAPFLEITSPRNGAEVHKAEVKVTGVTEPGARVTYGEHKAKVADDGSWSIVVGLDKGANHIEVTASDEAGNAAGAEITVIYVVAEPTTTTTTVVEEPAEFVANATFGVCTLTPPYDVYFGQGEPGSTVYVQSEYGSGAVEVNGEGHWEIQVFFPEAPTGQAFLVSVYDSLGREKAFEFKYQPEGQD
jgi:hypothetical protein